MDAMEAQGLAQELKDTARYREIRVSAINDFDDFEVRGELKYRYLPDMKYIEAGFDTVSSHRCFWGTKHKRIHVFF